MDPAHDSQGADAATVAPSARLKVPPHSVPAERAVLGGLLIDTSAWDRIADRITAEDFYEARHRYIYRAVVELIDHQQPTDIVTLAAHLESHGRLEEAGGLAYLAGLAEDTATAAHIGVYADIVRNNAILRELIEVSGEVANQAFFPEGRSPQEVLELAEQAVLGIAERGNRSGRGFVDIKTLLTGAVDRINELYERDEVITGLPSGFTDLDEMTAGLQPSDLIIVAGRPSMGKTSFAMNIAENVAIRTRQPVAVFSMEMSGEQLALRLMSSLGRIDQHRVRTGKLLDEDWPRLTSAVQMLAEAPLYIDDTPALSPTDLGARARRLKREHGLGLIVVDYLQLMQAPGVREGRVNEISEISRGLKSIAKELNVPVIALSQLNRSLEQRPNKRPVMSDLRESGAIEQDADVIVFIYRDEVYNEDSADKGTAEIIIGKQRNGPIGMRRLTFLGQYTRFENFSSDFYSDH